ncbi:MAG: hypothetical protein U1G07_02880 [Verrucomicrobiota bacterium]
MDNPLVERGGAVYQPREPINLTYDAFGPPAALIRGLFEYLYAADALTLVPHIPPGLTQLRQQFPIRFGAKRLFLATAGEGDISSVRLNAKRWPMHTTQTVTLPYDRLPLTAFVEIMRGGAKPGPFERWDLPQPEPALPAEIDVSLVEAQARLRQVERFHQRLADAGLGATYEAAHAALILESARVIGERRHLLAHSKLPALPEASATAAMKCYAQTVIRLCDGLDALLGAYAKSGDAAQKRLFNLSQP